MFSQDYLNLRLVRVAYADAWLANKQGLSFLLLKGGVGMHGSGPAGQRLASGDLAVVKGADEAEVRVAAGQELVFWHFSLCVEHLFPLFAGEEISLVQSVLDGFTGLKLYPAASPLARECHRLIGEVPPQFNLDHRCQLLRVAGAILTEQFNTARGQRVGFVRAEDHLIQVFERLGSNELLNLSVGELAGRFGCSRRHLNRLFHQHFGFSVAALRMEMRLLKAISLLRNPDAKIIHIADKCGFNHLGLFNTCFKRRFGLSPGQWRKQILATEDTPSSPDKAGTCPLLATGICPQSRKPGVNTPIARAGSRAQTRDQGRLLIRLGAPGEISERNLPAIPRPGALESAAAARPAPYY